MNEYGILNCAKYFADDGLKNYLIFQPISKIFRMPVGDNETVTAWVKRKH